MQRIIRPYYEFNNMSRKIFPPKEPIKDFSRDEIFNWLQDDKINEINNFFCNLSSISLENSLINYCIDNNDMEFLKLIFDKYLNLSRLPFDTCSNVIKSNNSEIYDLFFAPERFQQNADIFYRVCMENNYVDGLITLSNYGHTYIGAIENVLYCGKGDILKYFSSIGYNLQHEFDSAIIHDDYFEYDLTYDILNTLLNNGIDISSKIDNFIIITIIQGYVDSVKLLVDYGYRNINFILQLAVIYNHVDGISYALDIGADITTIDESKINYQCLESIKLLTDNGYVFSNCKLSIFLSDFIEYNNVDYLQYVIDLGGNFDYAFDNKFGILEYLIVSNNFTRLKFIHDNSYDKFMKSLDRLFVIAIINGRIDIAEYLFDLGANINYFSTSIKLVILFGHYDILKFLLDKGIIIDDFVDLFEICACGTSTNTKIQYKFNELVPDCNIISENTINFGNGYNDIFDLLIDYQVTKPNNKLFFKILNPKYYSVKLIEYTNCYLDNNICEEIMGYCRDNNLTDIEKLLLDNIIIH